MAKPLRKTISAYDKVIDYLSRRDHSEYELKNKLSQKGFPDEEIDAAIARVKERGFVQKPNELANKVAETLHVKLKGILYIQEYLKSKELPIVNPDWDLEFEKAQKIAQKLALKQIKDNNSEALFRLLASRGFAESTIEMVINSKSSN